MKQISIIILLAVSLSVIFVTDAYSQNSKKRNKT